MLPGEALARSVADARTYSHTGRARVGIRLGGASVGADGPVKVNAMLSPWARTLRISSVVRLKRHMDMRHTQHRTPVQDVLVPVSDSCTTAYDEREWGSEPEPELSRGRSYIVGMSPNGIHVVARNCCFCDAHSFLSPPISLSLSLCKLAPVPSRAATHIRIAPMADDGQLSATTTKRKQKVDGCRRTVAAVARTSRARLGSCCTIGVR